MLETFNSHQQIQFSEWHSLFWNLCNLIKIFYNTKIQVCVALSNLDVNTQLKMCEKINWKVTQKICAIKKTQTNKISLENASSSTMEDDSRIRARRAAKVFDVCKVETQ